ncbi:ATPase [Klebsiella pneumoniae]|uniref:ATPase n=1 Tax=Klebsiella pneumoniae TaxID=573 RepID=A0A447RSK6_KLEPN|nr:ATPase [Klebsiella pneumoniae]
MQSLSPTSRYLLALKEGSHQPDDVQQEAVSRLDTILPGTADAARAGRVRRRFAREIRQNCWVKREPAAGTAPVRGLYMWGGVGRGKTWLMDLFYQSLPGERKQRLHFHRFHAARTRRADHPAGT